MAYAGSALFFRFGIDGASQFDFKLSKKTLDEFLSTLEFDEFDRVVSFKYDKVKEEIMAEASLYHDKRNWRRPGCKADMASICVIYN